MYESKKQLRMRIARLEDELFAYKRRSALEPRLEPCKSNMCYDCKYAVVTELLSGARRLHGCVKNCLCDDYEPVQLRTSADN